ncbi:hypothetical protein [Hyalangium sp.]|uniref:hypothetical protein n=1 Tax=Hyalangium sp. TaxID=2028555 RepID=UPI002D3409CA|nr:hypothetical protein [Hyalangium sp.]HYH98930.1 hypothetical protein [Hyalangium sp.]
MWLLAPFGLMMLGIYAATAPADFQKGQILTTAFGGLVIAGLNYLLLAVLWNRTEIVVTRATLRVRRGPVPWPGSKEIPTRHILQLHVRENWHQDKRSPHRKTRSFSLEALMQGEYSVPLLDGFKHENELTPLEQEIERWLGLENLPVEEEPPATKASSTRPGTRHRP